MHFVKLSDGIHRDDMASWRLGVVAKFVSPKITTSEIGNGILRLLIVLATCGVLLLGDLAAPKIYEAYPA